MLTPITQWIFRTNDCTEAKPQGWPSGVAHAIKTANGLKWVSGDTAEAAAQAVLEELQALYNQGVQLTRLDGVVFERSVLGQENRALVTQVFSCGTQHAALGAAPEFFIPGAE